jgi:hypothetical protein
MTCTRADRRRRQVRAPTEPRRTRRAVVDGSDGSCDEVQLRYRARRRRQHRYTRARQQLSIVTA